MNQKFEELRKEYPVFTFESFSYWLQDDDLHLRFHFTIGERIGFSPEMVLRAGEKTPDWSRFDLNTLEGIVFNIGLVELVSYWKCTCSPTIHIKPFVLSEDQQWWWRKLYWYGLGEFFYRNDIKSDPMGFMSFKFDENAPSATGLKFPFVESSGSVLVPIGGGKDSVVTLEDLRTTRNVVPFIINPRGATLECAKVAGFPDSNQIVVLHRQIDPELLRLNGEGFLNGHTPFSAMLAFYTVLASAITGIRDVALSNESSANEPTIPGTKINHQYSKSLEFEEDFREYVHDFMGDCNHYYSHLRQLSELQIAKCFAKHPQYFSVFKSCNVGSKEDKWCGHCAKCLFAYIILSPFIDDATMQSIFGRDMLDDPSLTHTLDELTGFSKEKPFECVGTMSEVNEAMRMISQSRSEKFLVKHYINEQLAQMENDMLDEYFNMAP